VSALPGVKMASAATAMPYTQHGESRVYDIEGRPDDPANRPGGNLQSVSPGYFATLRVPLRGGRFLEARDGPNAPLVAVVSEQAARRWFGNTDPIGRHIRVSGGENAPWMTIVGVVGNTVQSVYDRGPRSVLFAPFEQQPRAWMDLALRTAGDPLRLA